MPRTRSRHARAAVLALLCAAGCGVLPTAERDLGATVGFSALPNLGITVGAFQAFRGDELREDALELTSHFQFLDDKDLHDNGDPAAGDFTQFQIGLRRAWTEPLERRWTARGGIAWFRAEGEPNIVQEPGDYLGIYGGIGFEKVLGRGLSIGPDVTLILASRESSGKLDVLPQFTWRVSWRF